MGTRVYVALKIAHNNGIFTYCLKSELTDEAWFGRRVKVEFRKRVLTGVIIGVDKSETPNFKIKEVVEVMDEFAIITKEQLALMEFAARYYFNDLGTCVHLAIPKNEKAGRTKIKAAPNKEKTLPTLSAEQERAASTILENPQGRCV